MVGAQVYEWNPETNQWTQLEQVLQRRFYAVSIAPTLRNVTMPKP
jgi:hypothetical protein